ncbi:MAG: LysM domain-containing protein, partial [Roseiflexaceae bacterium]
MAQPVWVVRARRAQMRRQLISTHRLAQRQAREATFATYLAWLRYISQTIQPWRRRMTMAARAAIAARSVLENVPLESYVSTVPAVNPSMRAWIDVLHRISPRFAAHIVAISIVLTVALFSADMQLQLPPAFARLTLPTEQIINDIQVQRQIIGMEQSSNDEPALIVAPRANVAIEPAFADYHVLMEGDTLGQLAAHYHVSVESIFWANDLAATNVFGAGQELRIPRITGMTHVIEQGDTLDSIAARFQVQPQAIVLFAPNRLRADQPLPVGQEIFLPG